MEGPNPGIADDADPEGPALQVQKPLFGLEQHLPVLVGPAPEEEALADLWWLFGVLAFCFVVACVSGVLIFFFSVCVWCVCMVCVYVCVCFIFSGFAGDVVDGADSYVYITLEERTHARTWTIVNKVMASRKKSPLPSQSVWESQYR